MNPKCFEKRLIEFGQAIVIDFDISLVTWNAVFLLESKDPEKPNQRILLASPELFYSDNKKWIDPKSEHIHEEMEIPNRAMAVGFCLLKKPTAHSEFISLLEEEGSLTIYGVSRQSEISKKTSLVGSSVKTKAIGSYQFVD